MSSQLLENASLEISLSTVISPAPNQVASELNDEAVILNMDSGIYYGLNDVGARIWKLIQQPCSIGKLTETLLAEYDVDHEVCTLELVRILQELKAASLIEVSNEQA